MHGESVHLGAGAQRIEGVLRQPDNPCIGLVILAQEGSQRRCKPVTDYLAGVLRDAGLATLWIDLACGGSESCSESANESGNNESGENESDNTALAGSRGYASVSANGAATVCREPAAQIAHLTARLNAVVDWLRAQPATCDLPLGVFCVKQCAAAALHLAAQREGIAAIVSRGGRADLAARQLLPRIHTPTLLIVGDLDEAQVRVSRHAYAALRCKKRFEIIPGANHSFEEPGNPEVVARLARGWFLEHAGSALAP